MAELSCGVLGCNLTGISSGRTTKCPWLVPTQVPLCDCGDSHLLPLLPYLLRFLQMCCSAACAVAPFPMLQGVSLRWLVVGRLCREEQAAAILYPKSGQQLEGWSLAWREEGGGWAVTLSWHFTSTPASRKEERKKEKKKKNPVRGIIFFWWKITQKAQITFCSGVCIWKAQSCSNYLLKRVARTQIPPSASLCRWHLDFSCVKCPWVKSPTVIWLLCIDRFSPCRGTFSCAEEEPGAGGFFKTRKNRGPKRLMSSSLSCRQACFPWLIAHLLSGVVIMCGFMVVVRYWKAIGRLFLHF